MIDGELPRALPGLAEDDQLVPHGNHLLDVVNIEPPADEPRAERGGRILLERDLDHHFPAPQPFCRDPQNRAADTYGLLGLRPRKMVERPAILIPLWVMRQEILDGVDAETLEVPDPLRRQPGEVSEGLDEGSVGHGGSLLLEHELELELELEPFQRVKVPPLALRGWREGP